MGRDGVLSSRLSLNRVRATARWAVENCLVGRAAQFAGPALNAASAVSSATPVHRWMTAIAASAKST